MLNHPSSSVLDGARARLRGWNDEADRFRIAAIAARRGQAPSSMTRGAAEDVQHGLIMLLTRIDRELDRLAPGHPDFQGLLLVRNAASALLESIDASLDELDRSIAILAPEPTRIEHRALLQAAE